MKTPKIDFSLEEMFIEKSKNHPQQFKVSPSTQKRSDNIQNAEHSSRKRKSCFREGTEEMFIKLSTQVKKLNKKIQTRQKQMKYMKNTFSKSSWKQYGLNKSKLLLSLKIIDEYPCYEYEDQRFTIQNIINLIADGELKPNTFEFNKISKIIRMLLGKDKKRTMNEDDKIRVENEIVITKQEYETYLRLKESNEALYKEVRHLQLCSSNFLSSLFSFDFLQLVNRARGEMEGLISDSSAFLSMIDSNLISKINTNENGSISILSDAQRSFLSSANIIHKNNNDLSYLLLGNNYGNIVHPGASLFINVYQQLLECSAFFSILSEQYRRKI